jgi:hypothetical protein
MEMIFGLAGIFGLGILGAMAGLDARALTGRRNGNPSHIEDPNSTMGVTRAVLAEKLGPGSAETLVVNC